MMTKEQAAKYFIVAWVKDWSMRTYFNTVTQADMQRRYEWEDAHSLYPWLPKDPGTFIRNATVRRYIGDNFRRLRDMLWDSDTNEQRLALWSLVLQCSGDDAVVSRQQKLSGAEIYQARKTKNQYRLHVADRVLQPEQNTRHDRTHWKTCK